jgi:hypothetical protein
MDRVLYAGRLGDYAFDPATGRPLPNAQVPVYDALAGGTQLTDLLTEAGMATTTVPADANGGLRFYAPDGVVGTLYFEGVVGGQPKRYPVEPSDLASRVAAGSSGPTGTVTAANVSVDTSGGLQGPNAQAALDDIDDRIRLIPSGPIGPEGTRSTYFRWDAPRAGDATEWQYIPRTRQITSRPFMQAPAAVPGDVVAHVEVATFDAATGAIGPPTSLYTTLANRPRIPSGLAAALAPAAPDTQSIPAARVLRAVADQVPGGSGAISRVGVASGTSGAATVSSFTLALPAGIEAGCLLVGCVALCVNSGVTLPRLATPLPGGWNAQQFIPSSSTGALLGMYVLYRAADASESAPTFSLTGPAEVGRACVALRSAVTSPPFDIYSSSTGGNANATIPGGTPAADSEIAYAFTAIRYQANSGTGHTQTPTPNDLTITELADVMTSMATGSNANVGLAVYEIPLATAGTAMPSYTVATSANSANVGSRINTTASVKAVAAAGGVPQLTLQVDLDDPLLAAGPTPVLVIDGGTP